MTTRPTSSRARTTLFNWLNFEVAGAKILDLFAGSGVLGFEALSRGAKHVTFVDQNRRQVECLKQTCTDLAVNADQAHVVQNHAIAWLRHQNDRCWDLIFIDPPFSRIDLYKNSLKLAAEHLTDDGLVYIEHPIRQSIDTDGFDLWKTSTIGESQIELFSRGDVAHVAKTN